MCDVHSLSFLFKFNCCICFRSLINRFQNLGYAVLLLFLSFSDLYLSMFFLDIILFYPRACLKNHFRNLHAPLCGIFHPNSVAVARYGALIRAKYPTNCDAHLAESLFQTHSNLADEFVPIIMCFFLQ